MNAENNELTAEYATKLFFHSYRFSQGSTWLQQDIFGYLHFLRPDWTLREPLVSRVQSLSETMILAFLTPNSNTLHKFELDRDNNIELKQLTDPLFQMSKALGNATGTATLGSLVARLTKGILEQDRLFLVQKREGRFRIGQGSSPVTDPWMSHFKHFVIDQHPAGLPEYNQMFQDIRSLYEAGGAQSDPEWLASVASAWEIHHPGQIFFPTS